MRTPSRFFFVLGWLALASGRLTAAEEPSLEIPGVTVGSIDVGASLKSQMAAQGKTTSLNRVVEALNATLSSDFSATGRFQMIEATDRVASLIKEQEFNNSGNTAAGSGGQAGQLIGASYLIRTQITSYLDSVAELKLPTQNMIKFRRTVELSGVVQIVNVGTRAILATINPKVTLLKVYDVTRELKLPAAETDEVLDRVARAYSQKVVSGVMDRLHPYVVLSVRGKVASIDAGDTSGIAKGQLWEFYAVEEIVHPVTKKKMRDEVLVGFGKVSAVRGDRATLETQEDNGIQPGAVARLKDESSVSEK